MPDQAIAIQSCHPPLPSLAPTASASQPVSPTTSPAGYQQRERRRARARGATRTRAEKQPPPPPPPLPLAPHRIALALALARSPISPQVPRRSDDPRPPPHCGARGCRSIPRPAVLSPCCRESVPRLDSSSALLPWRRPPPEPRPRRARALRGLVTSRYQSLILPPYADFWRALFDACMYGTPRSGSGDFGLSPLCSLVVAFKGSSHPVLFIIEALACVAGSVED